MDAKVRRNLDRLGFGTDQDLLSAIVAEPARFLAMFGLDTLVRVTVELASGMSLEQTSKLLHGTRCFCGQPVVVDCPISEDNGTI